MKKNKLTLTQEFKYKDAQPEGGIEDEILFKVQTEIVFKDHGLTDGQREKIGKTLAEQFGVYMGDLVQESFDEVLCFYESNLFVAFEMPDGFEREKITTESTTHQIESIRCPL